MEITYYGHSCFKIKGNEVSIVIDPFDPGIGYNPLKLESDILLLSHNHHDHAYTEGVKNYSLFANSPGEYELNNVFVYGLQTFHDNEEGAKRGINTIYLIDIDGYSILHLGDLGHELSKETLEKISGSDVLMIPVGGTYTIDAKTATKVISSLEPGYVLPMHYQTKELSLGEKIDAIDVFLNEMGVDKPKNSDKLKLSRKGDVPEESEVVVLSISK
jgi:L-ascorbate metabolism protein UlaG (beta-lactamase superfamily)